jgi:hypothetical protein
LVPNHRRYLQLSALAVRLWGGGAVWAAQRRLGEGGGADGESRPHNSTQSKHGTAICILFIAHKYN